MDISFLNIQPAAASVANLPINILLYANDRPGSQNLSVNFIFVPKLIQYAYFTPGRRSNSIFSSKMEPANASLDIEFDFSDPP